MPALPIIGAVVGYTAAGTATAALVGTSIGLTAYSMYEGNKASKAAASTVHSTAEYNASLDRANARQVELDTKANVQAARAEASIYLSRMHTAYAASGVLNTGTPLDAQVTTAGRLEQRVQQMRVNSQREQDRLNSAAQAGILYGDAQASAIRQQNTANMLRGGANLLTSAYGAYQSGAFSGGGAWSKFDSIDFVGGTGGSAFNY